MRRSLLLRLLALSALVALGAIGATAWLAARTTSGAIQQEQGQALADDGRIFQDLLTFAATHKDWSAVAPQVKTSGQATGRRIVLTTPQGAPIADSAPDGRPLPRTPSAVVDPLAVDPGLGVNTPPDRIAPEAVGPFALTAAERTKLAGLAQRVQGCLQKIYGAGTIVDAPNGHPQFDGVASFQVYACGGAALADPTTTEQNALDQLSTLVNACVNRGHAGTAQMSVVVLPGFTWIVKAADPTAAGESDQAVQACLTAARREQLTPYVAPAANLYLLSPEAAGPPAGFTLSPGNKLRLAAVAGGVLLLAVAITVLAGMRLIRPLRALTAATQRMESGETAHVAVRGKDEIARLATAFNDMAASRERAERQRRAMVSDIAHELRTPLSNIRGWLEASQDGITRFDEHLVASLHEEAVQLQHIVDDLQDLALADAGRLRLHPEPLDLPHLLGQVAAAHTARAEAAGVVLGFASPASLDLTADPVRLRQVVTNLVSNAIRHTPRGGTVDVRARAEADDVVIEVADTGTGIPPEDLPHVFDRFWRADAARTTAAADGTGPRGGSGLGLAIVRQLAQAHGGTVTATSVPGEGSVFTLRLPAEPAAIADS